MTYNKQSKAAIDFARSVKKRILGNEDSQRLCFGQPSRAYDFGMLFPCTDAETNRRGDRSIFKPNAITVRFEVPKDALPDLELEIRPSFWLYFRRAPGETPPSDWGDCFDPKGIWIEWQKRDATVEDKYTPKQWLDRQRQDTSEEQSGDNEEIRPFVRKRYANSYTGTLDKLGQVGLDLEKFRDTWQWLGDSSTPRWQGHVEVNKRPGSNDESTLIEVRLVNDYRYNQKYGLRGEPSWFDVRLGIKFKSRTLPIYCPLLDKEYPGIRVQTVNCVLDQHQSHFTEDGSIVIVEQVGEVIRERRTMVCASPFADAARNGKLLLQDARSAALQAEEHDQEHATILRQACKRIESDAAAMKALDIVTETFGRSFTVQRTAKNAEFDQPVPTWYLHQAAIIVLAAAAYLDGSRTLHPLVINVPTAGGKTEAFVAAAFWTVAYEALHSGRLGTAIVKYPTTMLSDDQASRLARYVMEFDAVMSERVSGYKPRGLGLFFGRDKDSIDPMERVGNECPVCAASWNAVDTLEGQCGRRLGCPNGHGLFISIHDEVFYMRPVIVVSTLHKFVAKSKKGVMRTLLGGRGYWCQHKRQVTHKSYCWSEAQRKKLEHKPARERALITTIVLDEAHMIREDTGALASHFETHYLEMARLLGGRYPSVLVSTATISGVEHHTWQLGLGREPVIFPGKDDQNEKIYYEPTGQVHHVILACMPRGRAIAWAVPHLVGDYINVVEGKPDRFRPFVPSIVYCPSYLTRDQISNGLQRQVNEPRKSSGRRSLVVDEFSRQRFSQEGQDAVLRRLEEEDVHVVLSTNIASVGVDLPNLNSIVYFGVPVNISEFVQSLNRVARKIDQPGVAFLVLDPYKERDNSYYAYLEPFALFPHRIVEAIPLNRYARQAIDETFDAIAMAQINHLWRYEIKGPSILKPSGFKAARGRQLSDTRVVSLLLNTYRANDDPSEAYPSRVQSLWTNLANTLARFMGRWIWEAPNVKSMYSLIPEQPQGILRFSPEAQLLKQANIRAVYGFDRTEIGNLADEEFGLVDGASEDTEIED